ncbi:PAP2 family protein [Bacteriovorax stolpii]|uniref:Uncharacterized protein n=1 Tax=Bacteriovorax stolpii TaxID=960 RepID=A0A2K9NU53_BACTC|nr:phosphatase PAP2 family protein [Bacteriovorax stolpii]AUN99049.1 hypothetical protein C0V70_13240 [Bacteriovorax stolpii]QDK40957.1 PAP2 family protein [Bacteriovorax stolpii]TDP55425.1 PAP2 superfamily protein [Bacteriovorax stolpii]
MRKLLPALLLVISSNSFAWDTTNFKDEALSPFTTSARNALMVGTGLTLSVLLLEDSIVDYTQNEVANDKPLGSLSKFGDLSGQLLPNAIYALGQSLAGVNGDPEGYRRAIGMLKASAYASGVTTALKYTIREPRPINGHKDKNSFPSGHTTTAFAFSGYVLGEHGWAWGTPALALSTFVGISRINDNRHFLHDVLAGATIGLSYGLGIAKLDKPKKDNGEKERGLTIVPIFDWNTKGLALVGEF